MVTKRNKGSKTAGASGSKKSSASAWSLVAPAQHQSRISADKMLNSANCGVLIHRTGQLKNEFRSEGRVFAREVLEYINEAQAGRATIFLYEETFGTQDRIHWLIHMKSLEDYVDLIKMGDSDESFREIFVRDRISADKGYGKWDRMFLDATFTETVLTAHHWGDHGTRYSPTDRAGARREVPKSIVESAQHQTDRSAGETFNSANAGAIIHRSGQLRYEFRSEGREFARNVVDHINGAQRGIATTFLYEEHFGPQDRLHWLTHMRNMGDYHALCQMGTNDGEFRNIFQREAGGSNGGKDWSRMFVDGSMKDTLLVPQHWRMYGTKNGSK